MLTLPDNPCLWGCTQDHIHWHTPTSLPMDRIQFTALACGYCGRRGPAITDASEIKPWVCESCSR